MPNIETPTDALFSCLLLSIVTPLDFQHEEYVKKAEELAVKFDEDEVEQIKNLIEIALTIIPPAQIEEQPPKQTIFKGK